VEGGSGEPATVARGMEGGGLGQKEGSDNILICGEGKRRERRKKKMGGFMNPPIFVS
jgi:hypothetical protein